MGLFFSSSGRIYFMCNNNPRGFYIRNYIRQKSCVLAVLHIVFYILNLFHIIYLILKFCILCCKNIKI